MKVVLILSGGMDSTTLLYDLLDEGHEVKALGFNYGQKHSKELSYAAITCKKLNAEYKVVDLTAITPLINNSALTGGVAVPEGHYTDENQKITVVPNRNAIMLSIAVGYAENLKYNCVAIANHFGDNAIYPDCRKIFIDAFSVAEQLATYNNIYIYAPYTLLSKIDIAEIGLGLGIDYDKDTWSCYKGLTKPCGVCGTCVERLEAIGGAWRRLDGN